MKQLISLLFIIAFAIFFFGGCKSENTGDEISGRWTLKYQVSISFPDSSGSLIYTSATSEYNNDTFNITFANGNYSSTFPSYYFTNTSSQTIWETTNGTYTLHDSVLEVSTTPSALLHQFIHLGFPNGVASISVFKKLSPDKLLILSTYGKMYVKPYGFDSTVLVRH